jgi:hypothetical protein
MLEVSTLCLPGVKDGSAWKVWLEYYLILLNDELKTFISLKRTFDATIIIIYFLIHCMSLCLNEN